MYIQLLGEKFLIKIIGRKMDNNKLFKFIKDNFGIAFNETEQQAKELTEKIFTNYFWVTLGEEFKLIKGGYYYNENSPNGIHGWKEYPPVPHLFYVIINIELGIIEYGNKDFEICKKHFENNYKGKPYYQIIEVVEHFK